MELSYPVITVTQTQTHRRKAMPVISGVYKVKADFKQVAKFKICNNEGVDSPEHVVIY